jgi:hypothetical protein
MKFFKKKKRCLLSFRHRLLRGIVSFLQFSSLLLIVLYIDLPWFRLQHCEWISYTMSSICRATIRSSSWHLFQPHPDVLYGKTAFSFFAVEYWVSLYSICVYVFQNSKCICISLISVKITNPECDFKQNTNLNPWINPRRRDHFLFFRGT